MNFNSKSPFEKPSPFSSQPSSPFDSQSSINGKSSLKNQLNDKKSSFKKKSSDGNYKPFNKKLKDEAVDLSQFDDMSSHTESRKVKKFFAFAIPIVVLELIAILCIVIYLIILPKNFCTISTNYDKAIVYVNGKETKKFRFQEPQESADRYDYVVDISIKLPGDELYQVAFSFSSDDYKISATTSAIKQDNTYYMQVYGGEKTKLLSAIVLRSNSKMKDFDVKMKINVTKL